MYQTPNNENEQFKQDQIDQKLVNNGNIVEEGIKSDFWQEIIGPELHRMISGGIGSQLPNGKWVSGEWYGSISTDNMKFVAGYVKGLQDFSNNILAFIDAKNNVLKRKERHNQKQEIVYPMTEDV